MTFPSARRSGFLVNGIGQMANNTLGKEYSTGFIETLGVLLSYPASAPPVPLHSSSPLKQMEEH